MTTLLIDRLRAITQRKARFSYDVRGNTYVYSGMVAPYRFANEEGDVNELEAVIDHALENDGIVSGVKDVASGKWTFTSDRLYSDMGNALRFAREQGQPTVYNWNRSEEVAVALPPKAVTESTATTEVQG
jgi:hypothetical protein